MEENRRFGQRRRVVKEMPRIGVNPSPRQQERMRVINYLQTIRVDGMRKHLCFSCAVVKLFDKNNKSYAITRTATLKEVKQIVEEIRKINAE